MNDSTGTDDSTGTNDGNRRASFGGLWHPVEGYIFASVTKMSVDHHMPVRRLLTVFYTGKDGVNPRKILIFRQKLGGVNSASGEKLHAFKIICPARWGAIATPQPLCVRACFTSTIRRKSPDTCIKPMSAFVIFIKHQFLIPPPTPISMQFGCLLL